MKKLLAFILLLPLFSSAAPTTNKADVYFSFQDVTRSLQPLRAFYLYPVPPASCTNEVAIVTRDRVAKNVGTNSSIIISNLLTGPCGCYRGEFVGYFTTTTNWFCFPSTNITGANGYLNAMDWLGPCDANGVVQITVIQGAGGSATNVVVRPGQPGAVSTNVSGSDYTVTSIPQSSGKGTNATFYFSSATGGNPTNKAPYWVGAMGSSFDSASWILNPHPVPTNFVGASFLTIVNVDNKPQPAGLIYYWGDQTIGAQSIRIGDSDAGQQDARFTIGFLNSGGDEDHTVKVHTNDIQVYTSGALIRDVVRWDSSTYGLTYGATNGINTLAGTNITLKPGTVPVLTASNFVVKVLKPLQVGTSGADGQLQMWNDTAGAYKTLKYDGADDVWTLDSGLIAGGAARLTSGTLNIDSLNGVGHGLAGLDSGGGAERVTVGSGLSISGGTLTATGGGGGGVTPTFDPNQFGGPAGGTNIISGFQGTNFTLRPANNGSTGLIIKGLTGQNGSLFSLLDVSGGLLAFIGADGAATFIGNETVGGALDVTNTINARGALAVAGIVDVTNNVNVRGVSAFTVTNNGNSVQITSNQISITTSGNATVSSSTGPLVLAPQGAVTTNQGDLQVTGNLFAQYGYGGTNGNVPVVIYRNYNVTNNTGTTAYSNVVQVPIPAGCMGTNRSVHITIAGDYLQNSGSTTNISIVMRFGATTNYHTGATNSGNFSFSNRSGRQPFEIDVHIQNIGLANSQIMGGHILFAATGTANLVGEGLPTTGTIQSPVWGAATAIDTTSATTFFLDTQWQSQSSLCEFKVQYVKAVLE